MKNLSQRGFGFIEVVVGVGISTVILTGILLSFQSYLKRAVSLPERVAANFLAEEGLEALRFIRDENWATFAALSGGTRYLAFVGGTWTITETPEYINGALRSFTISDVSRNAEDDIITSGGVNDSGTKKAEMAVAFVERGATTTLTLSTYFANIHAN